MGMRNFKVIIFEIFVQNSLLIKQVPEIYTFFIDFNEKSAVLFDKNILITQKLSGIFWYLLRTTINNYFSFFHFISLKSFCLRKIFSLKKLKFKLLTITHDIKIKRLLLTIKSRIFIPSKLRSIRKLDIRIIPTKKKPTEIQLKTINNIDYYLPQIRTRIKNYIKYIEITAALIIITYNKLIFY